MFNYSMIASTGAHLLDAQLRPGGLIYVDKHDDLRLIQRDHVICVYCGRQTREPDLEYGCRGCGAQEFK